MQKMAVTNNKFETTNLHEKKPCVWRL